MRVVHRAPGRVRLDAPFIRGQVEHGRRIADAAAALEGVSKVEARTATGSVVIFHLDDWEPLAERIAQAAGVTIEARTEQAPVSRNALEGAADFIDAMDQGARRALGGRTDLSELAFLGLIVAGTVQLARGRYMGPATALFGQALTLMAARKSRSGGGA